ncbi:histone acetyltransferase, putative [Plasmodium relictum]|uniref:RNA cytidine acetyltransferase n=1 Tax=Plasmodium relictum TaxID=85471 RepID=A0A1J1H2J3_PLARL|nr:histone acetyltransferase, putative [Plasmodium relictum]CRG99068.1 histone acetyltransferase, putative [Plasmodium relictum]
MKKKVDSRIKILVENNVALGQRSMFLVIGDQGKNVVVNFYFLLNRLVNRSHDILWCYKKKLDFSTSKKKRFREMKKKIKKGTFDATVDNNFDSFLKNTNIRFCFYKETKKILGKTYSICVLQDFSYITPNILCRCIETVIGGGLIIFLINKLDELKDIYNLTLNYHKKYTMNGVCSAYNNYIHRFFLSLNKCKNAMFIDDEMNILPLNDNHIHIKKITSNLNNDSLNENYNNNNNDMNNLQNKKNILINDRKSATLGGFLCPDKNLLEEKLKFLENICEENEKKKEERKIFLYSSKFNAGDNSKKEDNDNVATTNNSNSKHMYSFLDRNIMNLLKICLSIDQLEILLNMCKILRNDEEKKRNIKEIIFSLLANRGRGKSATLGLLLSLSIYFNYSNIIISSGNNDGVQTIFEFLDKGLHILGFQEFKDYEKVYEMGKLKEIIIFKNIKYLKQRIRYFDIIEDEILNCELMIIDEAACIPIDILRNKIKGEITILSTTLNGYEGTGKTFTFKLLKQLKKKFITQLTYEEFKNMKYLYFDKAFVDLSLNNPIRYSYNDEIENWLNNFLCLNCNEASNLKDNLCSPNNCQLYFVNKNIFKNYNSTSENLLKKIMTLFVTSHYKNTPNDLIMILDSQQHHLFILINNNSLTDNIDNIDIYGVLHCAIDGVIYQDKIKKAVKLEDIVDIMKNNKRNDQNGYNQNGLNEANTNINNHINGTNKHFDKPINCINENSINYSNEINNNYSSQIEKNNMLQNNDLLNKEFEGNLIPYIISDYFDFYFYNYIGIRIVRISIHPSIQNLNYGSEFLKKICDYYNLYNSKDRKENSYYNENIILYNCNGIDVFFDEKLKKIDYIGTCFGLTKGLLIFWKKNNFIPVFLKQQKNEITGEFSILMLKHLNEELKDLFIKFYHDFVRSLCNLLPYSFKKLESFIVFNLLHNTTHLSKNIEDNIDNQQDNISCFYDNKLLNEKSISYFFHSNDICRLKRFVIEGRNFYEILYLLSIISKLILFKKVKIDLNFLEYTILYAVSFQKKTCKEISDEIKINVNQTNAIFRKIIHRFYNFIKDIMEKQIEKEVNEEIKEKLKKKKKKSLNKELPSEEYKEELKKNSLIIKKKHKNEKLSLMKEFNISGMFIYYYLYYRTLYIIYFLFLFIAFKYIFFNVSYCIIFFF